MQVPATAARGQAPVSLPPPFRRGRAIAICGSLPAIAVLPLVAFLPAIPEFETQANYLAVHSFVEAFACAVSVLTFGIGWYAAKIERSLHLAVLAVAFLALALLDLAHTLSYPGMPEMVTPSGAEKAIDFWLAARFAQAIGLLGFAVIPWHWKTGPLARSFVLALALGYTGLTYWLVLEAPDVLPRMFVPGIGLTPFKVDAEYLVIAIQVIVIVALLVCRHERRDVAMPMLLAAVVVLVACELAVTQYLDVNDNYNFIGHVFKFIGFWLIYRAVFVRGIRQPYRDKEASELLYRRLTEQAADAILQLDQAGRIVAVNPRSEHLTGWDADALCGRTLGDLLSGSAMDQQTVGQETDGVRIPVFESAIKRRDGELVPVEISIGRLDDGGCLAIARDISERKKSDEAIRIRDMAFASSVVPLAMANLDGVLSYVNQGFIALLGYDHEDSVLGHPIQDFVLNPGIVSENLKVLVRDGKYNSDLRCVRRDGSIIVTQVSANVVYDGDDRPLCMIGSFKDITEQLTIMKALSESEQRFSSFFNGSPAGMAIFSPDCRWTHVNPVLSGRTTDPFVGRLPDDVLSPDVAAAVEASIRKVVATGQPIVNLEHTGHLLFEPQSVRRWLVSYFPLLAEDGSVTAVGAVVIDTTGLAEIEAQLRQVQRIEALGKLTGGLAHDSNNYLGVIIGNLDLLRDLKADDPAAVPLIEDALTAALRGAALTRSLLAFARRQPLNPQRIDLNAQIEAVTNLLRRTLGEDLLIETRFAPQLRSVRIDGAQLDSCIVNLANNARDAMPHGGTLTISTANVHLGDDFVRVNPGSEAGDYVMIEVLDTGGGMPPDVAARAFEPFFTTKGPGTGTGLGLSMVHGFVKQSGGYIKIESEAGHGTSVRIYLPPAIEPAGTATVTLASPAPSAGTGTILVVEDNGPMRKIVSAQLSGLGYQVVEAANGAEALDILDRAALPLDLMFTDIIMPGKPNGAELAKLARDRRPGLPVLLTSGYSDNLLNDRRDADADILLLRKPYRRDELARAVQRALTAPIQTASAAG